MKSYKILLFVLFSLVLISSVTVADKVEIQQNNGILITDANQEYIEKDKNYTFDFHLQRLDDGTLITDNNTDCHFHLYNNDGSPLFEGNLTYGSTGFGDNWDIKLNGSYFSEVGEKNYIISCEDELSQIGGSRTEKITVTPTGTNPSTSQALIYIALILVTLTFLILSIYGSIRIKWENNKDARDDIIGINELKYAKIGLIFVAYLLFLFLFAIGKDIAQSYLFLTGAYGLFNVGFTILLVGLAPILIATIALIIMAIISDKEIQEAISRGIDPEHLRRGK